MSLLSAHLHANISIACSIITAEPQSNINTFERFVIEFITILDFDKIFQKFLINFIWYLQLTFEWNN